MLNYQTFGDEGSQPVLLIAHGLFGSGRNWGVIAKRLSDNYRVVTVDMRNHAGSFWSDDHSYPAMALDLAELIESLGPSSINVLGHSMGGKAAMVLALSRPDLVAKLIVADIAPVGYAHSQMQPIEYMRNVELSAVTRRSDVLAQLDGLAPGVPEFIAQSLDVKEKKWRLNLDVLADQMDGIIGFPDISGSYNGRTLFLSGATSDYVKQEHRAVIKPLFPKAKFARIPGAGHWLHAEKPREFEAVLRVFLDA